MTDTRSEQAATKTVPCSNCDALGYHVVTINHQPCSSCAGSGNLPDLLDALDQSFKHAKAARQNDPHAKTTPGIDPWPDDEDMALACRCGHTLGQHSYGAEYAPCDYCPCDLFNDVMPDGSAAVASREVDRTPTANPERMGVRVIAPTKPSDIRVGDHIMWADHEAIVVETTVGKHRISKGRGIGMDAYLTLDTPVGEQRCHWHASEKVQRIVPPSSGNGGGA